MELSMTRVVPIPQFAQTAYTIFRSLYRYWCWCSQLVAFHHWHYTVSGL